MKFLNFLIFFLLFVGLFALLAPDSKSGCGSTDLIEFGSNLDLKLWEEL
jgi:hypothetical protein